MRAPDFWWRPERSRLARLLSPLAWIFGAIASRRLGQSGVRAGVPVICVGNFTVGGTGKTPVVAALGRLLGEGGRRPVVLSRGYGGSLPGPVRVDPARHTPAQVGDEPLLLADILPVVVSRDRVAGARACLAEGADVILMDDGLQNPSLRKDLRLVVIDGATGFGNGLCLPAGPLRAPLARQWTLADALVVMGEGEAGERVSAEARERGLPVLSARLEPDPSALEHLRQGPLLAFAGIGRPEKFFTTLVRGGCELADTRAFDDHHVYTPAQLDHLAKRADRLGARLVTTQKDWVRIAATDKDLAGRVAVLPVTALFAEPDSLKRLAASARLQDASGRGL